MATAANLTANASVNTTDFSRGTQRMQADLKALQAQAAQNSVALGALGGALTGLAGAALSLGALKAALTDIVKTGLQLENLRNSFTAITGSAQKSREEFGFVRDQANKLGLDIDALGAAYRSLLAASKGTTLEGQASRDLFSALTTASRAYGLSTDQTGRALLALQQIISKGKVSQEELRQQLSEALPGATQIAARAFGVTTQELDKLVEKGIPAAEFIKRFTDQLSREVPGGASVAGSGISRLGNEILLLKDRIAQSGILDFFDRASRFVADRLRAEREAGENQEAQARKQIRGQGVNPDQSRSDLVGFLGGVNAAIKTQEAEIARLRDVFNTSQNSSVLRAIGLAEERLSALRTEQQALVSTLQQEGLERQRTGAIAAAQNEKRTQELRAENDAKQADADATKARYNEIAAQTDKLVDQQEEQAAAEEQAAKRRVQLFGEVGSEQQRLLQGLQDELDALKMTEDELRKKQILSSSLEQSQRDRALALAEEIAVIKQQQTIASQTIQSSDVLPGAEKYRLDTIKERGNRLKAEFRDERREVKAFGDFFVETILNATEIGKTGFRGFADSVIADLQRLLVQQFLRPQLEGLVKLGIGLIGNLFGGGSGGGNYGGLAQGFDSATSPYDFGFGGARAAGGPVYPGMSYLVGEQGPERFTPGVPGAITPATTAVTINITGVSDAGSFRRSQGEISQRIALAVQRGLRAT